MSQIGMAMTWKGDNWRRHCRSLSARPSVARRPEVAARSLDALREPVGVREHGRASETAVERYPIGWLPFTFNQDTGNSDDGRTGGTRSPRSRCTAPPRFPSGKSIERAFELASSSPGRLDSGRPSLSVEYLSWPAASSTKPISTPRSDKGSRPITSTSCARYRRQLPPTTWL